MNHLDPGAPRPPRHHVAVLFTSQQQCSSLSNLVGPAVRQVLLAQAARVAGLHNPPCHARKLRPALHQDKLLECCLVVPAEGFEGRELRGSGSSSSRSPRETAGADYMQGLQSVLVAAVLLGSGGVDAHRGGPRLPRLLSAIGGREGLLGLRVC